MLIDIEGDRAIEDGRNGVLETQPTFHADGQPESERGPQHELVDGAW